MRKQYTINNKFKNLKKISKNVLTNQKKMI